MQNNYRINQGRSRIRWSRVFGVLGVFIVVVGLLIAINFNRILALSKGYNFKETSQILNLKKTAQREVLSHPKLVNISGWVNNSRNTSYYDEYERYYKMFPDLEFEDVILTIDGVMNLINPLEKLGYDSDILWNILTIATVSDLEILVNNNYSASELMNYFQVEGFQFRHYESYRNVYASYESYNYAVNIVNYPLIISENGVSASYTITNPDELLTLVKKGFYLAEDYVPNDLVEPPVAVVEDCENCFVREVMVEDLQRMFSDASRLGYDLIINSGYRSFEEQANIYQRIAGMYGSAYAAEYVAVPGASEHQLGLGIDLTSQRVVDGYNAVFRDTVDYHWVIENCYDYGFIHRFQESKSHITGIAEEAWHLRYVGVEAALIIRDEGLTLEEYCLKYSVIPDLKIN